MDNNKYVNLFTEQVEEHLELHEGFVWEDRGVEEGTDLHDLVHAGYNLRVTDEELRTEFLQIFE